MEIVDGHGILGGFVANVVADSVVITRFQAGSGQPEKTSG